MRQKGTIPLSILIVATILIIGGITIFSYQTFNKSNNQNGIVQVNSPSPPSASLIQVSPSPTAQTIAKATSNPTPKPTPTPNPCGMGKAPPVTPDPSVHIDSLSPTSGKVGDTIVIKGSGYGKSSFNYPDPTKFLGSVSFYGSICGYNSGGAPLACQDWDYSCWGETELKIKVPGVSTGGFQIEVTSADGKKSNRLDFQVLP